MPTALMVDLEKGKSKYQKFFPLGLLKYGTYLKEKGYKVKYIGVGEPIIGKPDLICFSFIFMFNHQMNIKWVMAYRKKYPNAKIEVGGPSLTMYADTYKKYLKNHVDYKIGIQDEFEYLKPDYDGAKINFSYGFTSRGCPRKCDWCIVPKIEGGVTNLPKWEYLIDKKHDLFSCMDNNIIALGPKKIDEVLGVIENKNMILDINQAMDCRIFANNTKIQDVFWKYNGRMKLFRFSWDSKEQDRYIDRTIEVTNAMKTKETNTWYMLYGFNDSLEEIHGRIKKLLSLKTQIKPMRFKNLISGKYNNSWGGMEKDFADAIAAANPTGLLVPAQSYLWGDTPKDFKENIKKILRAKKLLGRTLTSAESRRAVS